MPAARWAKSVAGVGPLIAAGLAAHIDISRCRTVSQLWRFAGYAPERERWNQPLHRLCRMAGEGFVRQENSFYGRCYRQRKRVEEQRHEAGSAARAQRWTVKLFLTHFHHVAWVAAMGEQPPRPFVIDVLGREGFIPPPGLEEEA